MTNNADEEIEWASVDTTTTSGSVTLTVNTSLYPSTPVDSDASEVVKITTTYATWSTNSGMTDTIDVTITVLDCDCSSLTWTAPSVTEISIELGGNFSAVVPVPTADNSATSSV